MTANTSQAWRLEGQLEFSIVCLFDVGLTKDFLLQKLITLNQQIYFAFSG